MPRQSAEKSGTISASSFNGGGSGSESHGPALASDCIFQTVAQLRPKSRVKKMNKKTPKVPNNEVGC